VNKYLLAVSMLSCILLPACAPGYVSKKPPDVVYVRPASPGRGYVWTTGEWKYSGGRYHWREGSWQKPVKSHTWKAGYWEKNKKGYRWHKGGWQS